MSSSCKAQYQKIRKKKNGIPFVESESNGLAEYSSKKKRFTNVNVTVKEDEALDVEPYTNEISHKDGLVQSSSKKKKRKSHVYSAIEENGVCESEHPTSSQILHADESMKNSSKKKKRKSHVYSAIEENGVCEAEHPTSYQILHDDESMKCSSKKKKRKSYVYSAIEENGACEEKHPFSNQIQHDDESVQSSSKKKKRKSSVYSVNDESRVSGAEHTNSNQILRDDDGSSAVAMSNKGVTKCKNIAEPAGVMITRQPEGKYVVGSLSKLFSSVPEGLPAQDHKTAVTIPEGQAVIKPKEHEKDTAVNSTVLNEEEVPPEVAVKSKDRIHQRMNRKRACEQGMTLEEKKRTLFVGNAPLTMDERSCKKLFSQYGKVESVRMRCIFPSKETVTKRVAHLSHSFHKKQTSLIFYVKFKDEESVQSALAYNGTVLERHRIRVDTCVSKAQYDRKLTVFVGNIPLDTKEDDLANFFEENVGDVSFARCVKDQSTGMGKGFAFVVFKSPASVPLALNMTGLQFHKREIRIMKVLKKKKVSKLQTARNNGQVVPSLTKEQSAKLDAYKFSTRRSQIHKRTLLKKKARKAIQRKKEHNHVKSVMQ